MPASFSAADDGFVGIALLTLVGDDALARQARSLLGQEAISIDRGRDSGVDAALTQRLLVRGPDVVVVRTMAGGRVHKAGACVVGDVITVEEWDSEVVAE